MAWEIQYRRGIWLPQIGWWLDAPTSVERSFVSHAHSDHIAAHREILCSPATARLMRVRLAARPRTHALPFGQAEPLTADTAVTLHPAGHILGSAQCLLTHPRAGTLLYTGDCKLTPGLAAEACELPPADALIMETTFGLPRYVFPPVEQIRADIVAFCREALDAGITPVLMGYSLGKSQELLQIVGRAALPAMLHPQAYRFTRIYEELGMRFPPYQAFAADAVSGHVVIFPPVPGGSPLLDAIPRRRTAIASGWALDPGAIYRYQCDAAFALSDHAGFPELLALVERVRPRVVYTVHGFAREFAQTLRARGQEAWALGADNQLELGLRA